MKSVAAESVLAAPSILKLRAFLNVTPSPQSQEPQRLHLEPLTSTTMRRTLRQLAAVKPSRFLEPGTPTGLAGLLTHPSPRGTLIYTYSRTLDGLKQLPESSLYRQSTEAITNHRLKIVTSVVPEGHEAWKQKTEALVKEHPEVFTTPEGGVPHDEEKHVKKTADGKVFMITKPDPVFNEVETEWDNEENTGPELEGTRTKEERAGQGTWGGERPGSDEKTVTLDPEPPLSVEQYVYHLP